MGDRYVVTKTKREGKAWYYSHVINLKGESRLCCQGTYALSTADAYFQDVQEAQKEALSGLNPYITMQYALSYLALNEKRCRSKPANEDETEIQKKPRRKRVSFNV